MTCQNKTCTHSAQIRYRDGRYLCWPCFNVMLMTQDRSNGETITAVTAAEKYYEPVEVETAVNGQPNG